MKEIISNIGKKIVSFFSHISPKAGSIVLYFFKTGKKLNLNKPIEFNEKLMWLKLNNYNNNELVWNCSDKYRLREYCKSLNIPNENLPELIGVYDDVEEIDFKLLPEKFALKCTHGQGFNIVCESKKNLNVESTKKILNKWLNKKFGYESAELHYTHIKPKIICEKFIENNNDGYPIDYKIYCFNGIPKIILVCVDRKKGYKTMFFDLNWKKLYLREKLIDKIIQKPKSFEEMIRLSKLLSKPFPFVRVDFYEQDGKAIIRELTFTPESCVGKYKKGESIKMGEMLVINNE